MQNLTDIRSFHAENAAQQNVSVAHGEAYQQRLKNALMEYQIRNGKKLEVKIRRQEDLAYIDTLIADETHENSVEKKRAIQTYLHEMWTGFNCCFFSRRRIHISTGHSLLQKLIRRTNKDFPDVRLLMDDLTATAKRLSEAKADRQNAAPQNPDELFREQIKTLQEQVRCLMECTQRQSDLIQELRGELTQNVRQDL